MAISVKYNVFYVLWLNTECMIRRVVKCIKTLQLTLFTVVEFCALRVRTWWQQNIVESSKMLFQRKVGNRFLWVLSFLGTCVPFLYVQCEVLECNTIDFRWVAKVDIFRLDFFSARSLCQSPLLLVQSHHETTHKSSITSLVSSFISIQRPVTEKILQRKRCDCYP